DRGGARRLVVGGDDEVGEDSREPALRGRQGERPKVARPVDLQQVGIGPIALAPRPPPPRRPRAGLTGAGPEEAGGRTRGQNPLDRRASVHPQSSLRRMRSRMWSDARHASAMIVSVGFLSALEANTAPSVR